MYTKIVHRTVLITLLALAYPAASFAGFFGVGVTVGFAPPPLPVYVQPPCPAPGYIWSPGYWAYSNDDGDYYWVPGSWVLAPSFGLLWTPGYWGLVDAEYVWHEGYWGPHVGFYGGINYGFGYFGSGFVGGYWRDHDFYYNRAVANVSNVRITNVYNHTVINNFHASRASFNGRNGVQAAPSRSDLIAAHERHRDLTAPQRAQAAFARALPSSLASANHGHPSIAATPRPGMLNGHGVTPPRSANRTLASSSHGGPINRSQAVSSNRNTASSARTINPRAQSSAAAQGQWAHEQQHPTAPAVQHVGFGPNTSHTLAAAARAPMAHGSLAASYRPPQPSNRPPQPNRVSPSYAPPNRPAFAQAPRNAPAVHHEAQAPRNAPAFHNPAQPSHVNQSVARNQRHG
jgi:hypothetical protein